MRSVVLGRGQIGGLCLGGLLGCGWLEKGVMRVRGFYLGLDDVEGGGRIWSLQLDSAAKAAPARPKTSRDGERCMFVFVMGV